MLGVVAVLAGGCERHPPAPPTVDTGARDAVRGFYDAVIRRDWPAAYALLHPDTTKNVTAAEFARRADSYRGRFGFEPAAVHVRTCEEQGEAATARVELTGRGPGRHEYKDASILRRRDGRWGVVLPARFGER